MLAWNRLRLDPGDGSPLRDYRIEKGHVETRVLDINMKFEPEGHCHWQRLTPPQLASHVMGNTVVAQWLQRRMGVHPLIRACAQSGHQMERAGESSPEARAA